jgi:phosphate-selective porin OprO and OprP
LPERQKESQVRRLLLVISLWFIAPALTASAQTDDRLKALEDRIHQLQEELRLLQQEVNSLKAPGDTGQAAVHDVKKPTAVEFGDRGLAVQSGEGDIRLRVRGYFQADTRSYLGEADSGAVDTLLLRRVRPILELNVFKDFDFRFAPDFGGESTTLMDAYFNWRILPQVQFLVGKIKSPTGLERLQSAAALAFVERGLPTAIVPNRDIGAQLHGIAFTDRLEYAFGWFNGTSDGGSVVSDVDSGKDMAARLFARPFASGSTPLRGLGLGIAGTHGNHEGTPSRYRTTGQQPAFRFSAGTVNDGSLWRLSPQGYYYYGPLGVLAEWAISSQRLRNGQIFDDIRNQAWQVMTSVVVSGEENSYRGVRPRRNLNPRSGAWGAFELVGRAGRLLIDEGAFPHFAAREGNAETILNLGLGLNWYPNRNIRFSTNYEVNRLSGDSVTSERTLFNRVQYAF